MTLQDLVCTTEQSRKFAELGIFGDSVFVWIGNTVDRRDLFGDGLRHMENYRGPAPTAQELFSWLRVEMLGRRIDSKQLRDAWLKLVTNWVISELTPGTLAAAILQIIEEQ